MSARIEAAAESMTCIFTRYLLCACDDMDACGPKYRGASALHALGVPKPAIDLKIPDSPRPHKQTS